MTFIYEHDPYPTKMYSQTKSKLSTSRLSKVIVLHTYRQTDVTELTRCFAGVIVVIVIIPVNSLDDDENLLPRTVGVWLSMNHSVTKFVLQVHHICTHQLSDWTFKTSNIRQLAFYGEQIHNIIHCMLTQTGYFQFSSTREIFAYCFIL